MDTAAKEAFLRSNRNQVVVLLASSHREVATRTAEEDPAQAANTISSTRRLHLPHVLVAVSEVAVHHSVGSDEIDLHLQEVPLEVAALERPRQILKIG